MAGRSSIERLLPPLLALVHEGILEGATIDQIIGRIGADGGICSRSAVVRNVKRARDRLRRWREDEGLGDFWLNSLGERPEGGTGRLGLAMHRIEGAGKSGADRESAAARKDSGRKKTAKGGGGLSPQAVAIIRTEVESGWRGRTPETRDVGALRLDSDSHPMRRSIRHKPT